MVRLAEITQTREVRLFFESQRSFCVTHCCNNCYYLQMLGDINSVFYEIALIPNPGPLVACFIFPPIISCNQTQRLYFR